MIETLERAPLIETPLVADDLAVRRALRKQIARLERRLGELAGELGRPGRSVPLPAGVRAAAAGPRLLGVAELERERDELIGRVRGAEERLADHADAESAAHRRVEAMLADPAAHRWAVVRREELGLPACGAYHVRPRLGLIGLLFDWWCVKLSSGCP